MKLGGNILISGVGMEYASQDKSSLQAITDIDLSIDDGSFWTLIGPSGCGKSTLLSIIAGLLTPSRGTVSVDGERVVGPDPNKMAMVFQDSTLLPWRSVRSNVEFPLEARKIPKQRRKELSVKYLQLVGLSKFIDFFPGQLSGGMQQRVAIARALAQEPEILLMDEPFGALDEQTRIILGRELTKIWETTRKTVVFVTHSLLEAAYLSDHIAIMSSRPGRLKQLVHVDVRRPRELEGPELADIRRQLWSQISEEASKLAGEG